MSKQNMEITDVTDEICRRLAILPNLCVDHSDPRIWCRFPVPTTRKRRMTWRIVCSAPPTMMAAASSIASVLIMNASSMPAACIWTKTTQSSSTATG